MALVPPPAGNSDHVGEEYMYILWKEYYTRYGHAQEAFRTRANPRGRPPVNMVVTMARCNYGAPPL
jgi:hypothetical protein